MISLLILIVIPPLPRSPSVYLFLLINLFLQIPPLSIYVIDVGPTTIIHIFPSYLNHPSLALWWVVSTIPRSRKAAMDGISLATLAKTGKFSKGYFELPGKVLHVFLWRPSLTSIVSGPFRRNLVHMGTSLCMTPRRKRSWRSRIQFEDLSSIQPTCLS